MSDSSTIISPLVCALHQSGPPRIWSVIVSIFGDAVIHHSEIIDLITIQQLTDQMGFEPGAVRTALSRLCSEKWLQRHKTGRNVAYSLEKQVKRDIEDASLRIYGPNFLPEPESWNLIVFPEPQEMQSEFAFAISPTLWAVPEHIEIDSLSIEKKQVMIFPTKGQTHLTPEWVGQYALNESIVQDYSKLNQIIAPMVHNRDALQFIQPREALVARILLIHFWRRIVLKHPPLYKSLLPQHWPGVISTENVIRLYHMLLPISEDWWINKPDAEAKAILSKRFIF